jgi:hypothetical protein
MGEITSHPCLPKKGFIMYNTSTLALGILLRAIADYKLLKRHGCTRMVIKNEGVISITELEEFFNSRWCDVLLDSISELNGRDILKMLQE